MSTDKKKKSTESVASREEQDLGRKREKDEMLHNDSELSDLEEADDSDEIDSDVETESETDVIDFTSDKLYQVLSGFFEAEDGTTITDAILHLSNRLDRQNDILKHIAKQLINISSPKVSEESVVEKTHKKKNKKDVPNVV